MTIEEIIREAIRERAPISLCYDSTGPALRIVHPHVLYRSSTGKVCVDCYQVDGSSSSGGMLPDWRPFNLAKITEVELLDGEFDIAPGLNLGSPKYSNGLLAHV